MQGWQSQMFSLEGSAEADNETLRLQDGRRTKAFDFCFQAYYPSTDDSQYRECIYQFSRLNTQAEKIFSAYLR
jgi:hypothetical protein